MIEMWKLRGFILDKEGVKKERVLFFVLFSDVELLLMILQYVSSCLICHITNDDNAFFQNLVDGKS
jgi:hypothetical protein